MVPETKTFDKKIQGTASLLKQDGAIFTFENKFEKRKTLKDRILLQKNKTSYQFLKNAEGLKTKISQWLEGKSVSATDKTRIENFISQYNQLVDDVRDKQAKKSVSLIKKIFQPKEYARLLEEAKQKYDKVKLDNISISLSSEAPLQPKNNNESHVESGVDNKLLKEGTEPKIQEQLPVSAVNNQELLRLEKLLSDYEEARKKLEAAKQHNQQHGERLLQLFDKDYQELQTLLERLRNSPNEKVVKEAPQTIDRLSKSLKTWNVIIAHSSTLLKDLPKEQTPLHRAITTYSSKIAKALIEKLEGSDLSTLNQDKQTPIYLAILWNKPDIAAALLDKLPVTDWSSPEGNTNSPLHCAIYKEMTDIAIRLIEKVPEATLYELSGSEEPPLCLALKSRSSAKAEKMAKALIERLEPSHLTTLNRGGRLHFG